MIPDRKWSPDMKWSPKWTANDPKPQMIPVVDRKWSPPENNEWYGFWVLGSFRNRVLIKSMQVVYVLVMVALSCYCCRSRLLRKGISLYELWFFPVIFQKNCKEKVRWICHEYNLNSILMANQSHFFLTILLKNYGKKSKLVNRKNISQQPRSTTTIAQCEHNVRG